MPSLDSSYHDPLAEGYELQSSETELDEFMKSPLYQDFLAIARSRLAAISRDLADPAKTSTIEQIRELQGEGRGVQFWERFPAILKMSLQEQATNG